MQFLTHLGIIFMEKEDTQGGVMNKEFKAKFINNLTNPPHKIVE